MKAEKWEAEAGNQMPLDAIYDQNGELVAGSTSDSQDDIILLTGADICKAVNNHDGLVKILKKHISTLEYINGVKRGYTVMSNCEQLLKEAREALARLEEE